MIQDDFVENDFEEKEIKTEKSKKLLIIMVILLLFGGTYSYYNSSKKVETANKIQPEIEVIKPVQESQQLVKKQATQQIVQEVTQEIKTVSKPLTKELDIKPNPNNNIVIAEKPVKQDNNQDKKEIKATAIPVNANQAIKPSDKTSLVRQALIAAGKADPFAGSSGQLVAQIRAKSKSYSKFDSLPPPPSSVDGLPIIGELPKLDISGNQIPSFRGNPIQDSINIKGFWGNKVIVTINGITESLKVNDSFQGIKVVHVDSGSLMAKFKRNGEVITKSIRNLTDLENNSDLRLVKDLNK